MELPEFPPITMLPASPAIPGCTDMAELPYVDQGQGVEFKVMQVDHAGGTWVTIHRFQPGVQVPSHRHSGNVIAYTLKGKWHYLEHDFTATAGSVVWEPAGSFHTLHVPDDAGVTEVLFVMSGGLALVDDDGRLWGVADAQTELASYRFLAGQQGKTIPDGAILGA